MTTPAATQGEASSDDSSPRLMAAVAEFLEAAERGPPPDRAALLARYADVAAGLAEFFADHDQMNALAQPLREPPRGPAGSTSRGLEPTIAPGECSFTDGGPNAPRERPLQIGPYEVEGEIGRGGMGVVYRARHVELRRTVALKTLLTGRLASGDDRTRFAAEAQAAARLSHSGIVPIFDVGQADGQPYFAMPLIEGPSLSERLHSGPLAPHEAVRLLRKIAAAVAYAHSHGVIHRDLKPGNVLLSRDDSSSSGPLDGSGLGEPKILDFGLAKRQGEAQLTASGQVLGTPSYMPPEQAAGRLNEVGPAADVYSLGAILYAMLTGRPPFQAESPVEVILQVLEREPPRPSQLARGVPQELECICLKCLEKRPTDRYAAADDLLADLDRFLRREPPEARRPTLWQRFRRWMRRQPVLAAHVIGLGVPLAIAQIVFVVHPLRDWAYHLRICGMLAGWIALTFVFQWLMERQRTSRWPLYLWCAADAALNTAVLSFLTAPLGGFVANYLVMIAAAALAGSTRLVAWMTGCCSLGYLVLVLTHPAAAEPPHYVVLSLLNFLLVGLLVGYQVWRMSILREYYGDRT